MNRTIIRLSDDRLAHGIGKNHHAEAVEQFRRHAGKLLSTRSVAAFVAEIDRLFAGRILLSTIGRNKGSRANAYALVLVPGKGNTFVPVKVVFSARHDTRVVAFPIPVLIENHVFARVLQRSIGTADSAAAVAALADHLILLCAHVLHLNTSDVWATAGDAFEVTGSGGSLRCTFAANYVQVRTWIAAHLITNPERREQAAKVGGCWLLHDGEYVGIGGLKEETAA